jgi:hypothetical protein
MTQAIRLDPTSASVGAKNRPPRETGERPRRRETKRPRQPIGVRALPANPPTRE